MLKRLSAAVLLILVVAGVAMGGAYVWFARTVASPGPLAQPTTVIIAPGSGLAAIARQLDAAGVITHDWMFELEARRSGRARELKPGEYRFEPAVSLGVALDKIVRRDVVARFVTIPEGLVTADIRRILDETPGLVGEADGAIADGDLLPETYRYEWGDSRAAIIGRMRTARDKAVAELWAARAPDLPLQSPEEAMVLASIVEKETGVGSERPRVAAVFINRLRLGMRLQSDPTVIYGIAPQTGNLEREITRADLNAFNAFNTYIVSGLPPSPICHPGRAALTAVVKPIQSDELYFVADGKGGHAFAATLDEHNRNVARWRKLQRDAAKNRER
jgi:UPF0755 protein